MIADSPRVLQRQPSTCTVSREPLSVWSSELGQGEGGGALNPKQHKHFCKVVPTLAPTRSDRARLPLATKASGVEDQCRSFSGSNLPFRIDVAADYSENEVALDYNAGLVGLVAGTIYVQST